ncbi:MAG TPA: ABC transporter permease [Smithellaceae bacterium]|nr:ABC transporter permease [Smithellaceae bacterium]
MYRQLIELVRKEMLVLIRDRQTILLLFLMPVALIFFMSLALEGVWADKLIGRKIPMAVDNQSRSPQARLLEGKIKAHPLIVPVEKPADADVDRIFAEGIAQAVVTIPPGFEEGDRPVEICFDPVMDASYRIAARSLVTSLTVEVVMGVDHLEAVVAGLVVERSGPNRELPTPLQQTVPAYAIFAMFFIAIPMSVGFLREKKDGTLQRLFTYPVSANLVTLGKIIPYYLINVIQFALMMLVGIFVMSRFITPAFHAGAHPWHMLPVTLVVAAATTGFGVLVAATAKTPEQSSTLAATGAILMGVFGGIMVPHVVMPPVMKKLAMISPMFWAHQAYLDIFLRDAAFGTILPRLIILTLFAIICFYIAGRKVRWI